MEKVWTSLRESVEEVEEVCQQRAQMRNPVHGPQGTTERQRHLKEKRGAPRRTVEAVEGEGRRQHETTRGR
jgi:hypothetical protein